MLEILAWIAFGYYLIGLAYMPAWMDDRLKGFGFSWDTVWSLMILAFFWLPLFLFRSFDYHDHSLDGTEWLILTRRQKMGLEASRDE